MSTFPILPWPTLRYYWRSLKRESNQKSPLRTGRIGLNLGGKSGGRASLPLRARMRPSLPQHQPRRFETDDDQYDAMLGCAARRTIAPEPQSCGNKTKTFLHRSLAAKLSVAETVSPSPSKQNSFDLCPGGPFRTGDRAGGRLGPCSLF